MDTLLFEGDHCLDSRGLPVRIDGERELIQRALLCLSIRRGRFAPDPTLGSELHRLREARADTLERLAISYAQQALAALPEVRVERASVRHGDQGILEVTVTIRHNQQIYPLEVTL